MPLFKINDALGWVVRDGQDKAVNLPGVPKFSEFYDHGDDDDEQLDKDDDFYELIVQLEDLNGLSRSRIRATGPPTVLRFSAAMMMGRRRPAIRMIVVLQQQQMRRRRRRRCSSACWAG